MSVPHSGPTWVFGLGLVHGAWPFYEEKMRTTLLLAAAAAIIPAASQAELLVNGSWDSMAANPNAVPANIQPSLPGREAYFRFQTTGQSDRWQIDSLTLDGITPYFTSYTPSASNFSLSIYSQFSQTIVATVTASSVGSYVSNGDGTSRFSVTFTNIPSPAHPFGINMPGFNSFSAYEVILDVINLNTLPFPDANFFTYRGFNFQGVSPIFNGEVAGVTWGGPLPMIINGTNLGAPAVPEPSTYGIVLGGLVLAGAVVRRRRAK